MREDEHAQQLLEKRELDPPERTRRYTADKQEVSAEWDEWVKQEPWWLRQDQDENWIKSQCRNSKA